MSEDDRIDIIIFGASGYSGKCVVQEFIKLNRERQFSWAVAGRNVQKLQNVLDWAFCKSDNNFTTIIPPIIIADCYNKETLNIMAERARVIINCCGPYRFYGKSVIEACIRNRTHYLDFSGEPEFMESAQLEYHDAAVQNGSYVVSACGLDGVPADFGIIYTIKKFPGTLNWVESYLLCSDNHSEPCGNIGTWESLIYSLANAENLKKIRPKVFSTLNSLELKPRLKFRWSTSIHRSSVFDGMISVPFPASDKSVALRTQQHLYRSSKQRPVQYQPYYVCSTWLHFFSMLWMTMWLLIFSRFRFGRKILIKFPGFFSGGTFGRVGPSEEARENSSAIFRFYGKGWSPDVTAAYENTEKINLPMDREILTEVSFFNYGYGFSAKSVILAAFTVLKESNLMPLTGGVYSPGAAFGETSFLDNLSNIGVTLKVLSNE